MTQRHLAKELLVAFVAPPARVLRKRAWDRHCPECGGDDVSIQYVRVASVRRACADCGHRWTEERELGQLNKNLHTDHRHMQGEER